MNVTRTKTCQVVFRKEHAQQRTGPSMIESRLSIARKVHTIKELSSCISKAKSGAKRNNV